MISDIVGPQQTFNLIGSSMNNIIMKPIKTIGYIVSISNIKLVDDNSNNKITRHDLLEAAERKERRYLAKHRQTHQN